MQPSVSNRLVAEPLMERIKGHGEPLRSIPDVLLFMRARLEQGFLLGKWREVGQVQGHETQPDTSPKGTVKQDAHRSGEINLPAGSRRDLFSHGHVPLVTVLDRQ